MRKLWLHLGYVQTQLPMSREERREVQRRANILAGRGKYFILKLALASVILLGGVVGGGPIVAVWLWKQVGVHPVAALIIAFAIAGLGSYLYAAMVWRWYTRPMRVALNELGYEVCVRCGYWLRDLSPSVPKSPECGAERMPVASAAMKRAGEASGSSSKTPAAAGELSVPASVDAKTIIVDPLCLARLQRTSLKAPAPASEEISESAEQRQRSRRRDRLADHAVRRRPGKGE